MIIKELNLIGFGQFNNKVIELKEGLNIIYGHNEAGKTTIHNFIDGMFYGFLKPYARTTRYTEDHDRYNPWDNPRYAGIIKFTFDGKEYRIERDFARNRESTNVFLDETGEEITTEIDTGNAGKVLQPGNHFFGFNDAVFSNTLSIKQMGNRTEDSLANEVRDKLVNVSTSLDDNLSVEDAIAELESAIKEIGSTRATTSPYGRSYKRIERLRERRLSILEKKDKYNDLLANKTKLDKDLNLKVDDRKQLEERLDDAKILAKNKICLEAISLKKSIAESEAKVEDNKRYAHLSMDDYLVGIDLKGSIVNTQEKIQENENDIIKLDNTIKDLERNEIERDESLSNIDRDFQRYEELEEEKNTLKYIDNSNRLQFLKRDLKENITEKKKLKFALNIGIVLLLLSFAFFSISTALVLATSIIGLFLVIYSLINTRKAKAQLVTIEKQVSDEKFKENQRLDKIGSIDDSLKKILDIYETSSKLDLKKLVDENRYILFNINQREDSLRENRLKKEDLVKKIDLLKEKKQENKKTLAKILDKNHSTDLDEFKLGLEKKDTYEDSLSDISSKTNLLSSILGSYQLEELEKEIKSYHKDISSIDEAMSIEKIENEISYIKDDISNIRIDTSRLEEQVNNLNNELSKLVEIDESIYRLEKFLEESDEKKEALELAKTTIEEISKDIHHQFAPAINKKVSSIIEGISGGKYSSVKIDNSLEIGVINPQTEEIVNIESLSGGTIDQLYFALRFGIVDSINNAGLPLILDDCFIQYDNKRLENILDFLQKKSEERQIILFTCHDRENKILDEMKVEYNLIELNS